MHVVTLDDGEAVVGYYALAPAQVAPGSGHAESAERTAAQAWYLKFGFEESPTDALHLLMLLKDARALAEAPANRLTAIPGRRQHCCYRWTT